DQRCCLLSPDGSGAPRRVPDRAYPDEPAPGRLDAAPRRGAPGAGVPGHAETGAPQGSLVDLVDAPAAALVRLVAPQGVGGAAAGSGGPAVGARARHAGAEDQVQRVAACPGPATRRQWLGG